VAQLRWGSCSNLLLETLDLLKVFDYTLFLGDVLEH
jgi:hypothetical protein